MTTQITETEGLTIAYMKLPLKNIHLFNKPFPSCFEPHYESDVKCKVFIMKISFHSYANKTNFHMKSFAVSLAFKMRFTALGNGLLMVFREAAILQYNVVRDQLHEFRASQPLSAV